MEIAKKDQQKPQTEEIRGRSGSASEYSHGKKKSAMQKTLLEDA